MKARSQSSSIPTRRFKGSSRKRMAERWSRARVLRELKRAANPTVRAKMAYFGVKVPKAYGISTPILHALARRIGKNHALAEQLWSSGIHEARISKGMGRAPSCRPLRLAGHVPIPSPGEGVTNPFPRCTLRASLF